MSESFTAETETAAPTPSLRGPLWAALGVVGAMTVALLLHYGALEFFGALMRGVGGGPT